MKPFQNINSMAIVLEIENIDTDQIIPARFLKTTQKKGLGKYLFFNWKSDAKAQLNREKSKILIAGNNFGCGSSREHAVWSLMDFGFKAVISSSFGDIFYNNSLKNGLLCLQLKVNELKKLMELIKQNPERELDISLEKQTIRINNKVFKFEIDSFRKSCLLLGVDELGYLLSHADKISAYEKNI